ncbi:MAG: hypothetical protein H6626_03860 [Pseudobdellovibrionaceae bacterium]|nr:hypothetical protein [Bdellovibrionales bacterium]USN48234.1 MAG: hypothetical protein H6626_03860 [Pseudobdellovibrionaceae bacterium]
MEDIIATSNFQNNDDFESGKAEPMLSHIPVPSQLPTALELDQLPDHVLRSGAVEALIQQNDDLMARLRVTLRRISVYEERLHRSESERQKILAEYENFRDQVLVLREKTVALSERHRVEEEALGELRSQVRLREIEYAELYTTSQDRQDELQKTVQKLSKQLARLSRYRHRVRRALQNFRNQFSNEKNEIESQFTQALENTKNSLNSHIQELTVNVSLLDKEKRYLQSELASETETKARLQKDLAEAAEYISEQAKQATENQTRLVDTYEDQLESLRRDLADASAEKQQLLRKMSDYDNVYERNVDLENQLILLKRQKEDSKTELDQEIIHLQEKLASYRVEAKNKTLENEGLREDKVSLHNQMLTIKQENNQLSEQVESLQCLWRDNQKQLEKQKDQNVALQKLNQSLSQKLNEYRQQATRLKEALDRNQLQQSTTSAATTEPSQNAPSDHEFSPDVMNRIDELIHEIHSGFTKMP